MLRVSVGKEPPVAFPFSKLHANARAQLCAEIILLHPTLIPSGAIMLVSITVKLILIILLMNRLLKCLFLMQLVEIATIPCKIQKVQMILSLVPEWNCLCYQAVQDNRIRSCSYPHHVASKLNTQGHPPSGPVWLIIQLNQLPLHLLHQLQFNKQHIVLLKTTSQLGRFFLEFGPQTQQQQLDVQKCLLT